MDAPALEQYLHQHIPLSAAMAVSVVRATSEQVVLAAPLQPNINHRDTVFGGSASALAILAAWSLVHVRLQTAGLNSRLVIQRNDISYEAPMADAFNAVADWGEDPPWERFLRMLERKGKARCVVHAVLVCRDRPAGRFRGEFVALGGSLPTTRA